MGLLLRLHFIKNSRAAEKSLDGISPAAYRRNLGIAA
jgi:hypothetical protein